MSNVIALHPEPTADEAAGLALLTPKQRRTLHPRAQVASLRRTAKIALGKAERTRTYSGDFAAAAVLDEKARVAVEAMVYLNRTHALGYPVPR